MDPFIFKAQLDNRTVCLVLVTQCVFKVPCLDFLKDSISSYLNLETQRLKYITEHSQQKLVPFNEVRSRSRSRKKFNPKSLCHFKLISLLLFQRVRRHPQDSISATASGSPSCPPPGLLLTVTSKR